MSWKLTIYGHVPGSASHQSHIEKLIHGELETVMARIHGLGSDVTSAAFEGSHTSHFPKMPTAPVADASPNPPTDG